MQYSRTLPDLVAHSLRENAVVVVLVLLHLAVAALLAHHYHFPLRLNWLVQLILFIAAYMILLGPAYLWLLARHRPESPVQFTGEFLKRWRLRDRLVIAAPAVLAMLVFLPAFSTLKSAIPYIEPYHLDPLLSRLDIRLHGEEAWQVIQPLVGHPAVSFVLNGVYHLWLGVFYLSLCAAMIWVEDLELRRRFLTAFVLCWALLGNLAATLLASVGPCFYDIFYGNDPYAGLMGYLHSADKVMPLAALRVQDQLAAWARSGMPGLGRGISAMPSMHVSIACLLMLASLKMGRRWAIAGVLFLGSIILGSVHLAYHYAIDGYASLAATPAIWWVSKHLKLPVRAPRSAEVAAVTA